MTSEFKFRPPPHSNKAEWERAREAARIPHWSDLILPTGWRNAINRRIDKSLGVGWDNCGLVTSFKVRSQAHPDKCVSSGTMLVRGDGKVLSGPRSTKDASFFEGKRETDCQSFYHNQTAEIINGWVKGPTVLEGYMYPGPPTDKATAETARAKD